MRALVVACLLVVPAGRATAAEYGFSSYGLGGAAFGAGATPPPGTYLTAVSAYYSGKIGGTVNFDDVVINAGARVGGYSSGLNWLYVPQRKLFDGNCSHGPVAARVLADHRSASSRHRHRLGLHLDGQNAQAAV